ncbi:MAG: hypothetical protein IPP73_04145 [Chitinophagaceae bacterium]|nr:hypothetical protein [Chitinophagaceae bacterium]
MKKLSPASLQWFIDNSAKHPAGNFDSVWAKRTLSGKFTPDQMNALGDIFMIMMAYQKMLNKEAREDRRLAQEDAKLETQAKNEKLNQDNQTINQQKQEAREKYDRSMQNANTELQIGIISSAGAIDMHRVIVAIQTIQIPMQMEQ